MQEITGNLFDLEGDALCILTNGFVNSQGANTMGKGCAGTAKRLWPGIQMVVGDLVQRYGNHVYLLNEQDEQGDWVLYTPGGWKNHTCNSALISFPTKEHWRNPSILSLIEQGAEELLGLTQAFGFEEVLLPRAGCGAGGLDWYGEVRPLLDGILDDRFYAVSFA